MRFGLVLPIQKQGAPLEVLLDELRAEVRAADEAGFDAFFFPEFHQAHGGALVSPLLVGAALAEGTRRIRVGTAVTAAPLHHPVRLAEDVLMLQYLTRGRALLGVGIAHQAPDFELFGVGRGSRAEILEEQLGILRACWSGEPFVHEGRHFRLRGHVTPAPYRGRRPELWMGAHGEAGLRRAGEHAEVWISDPQRDVDAIGRLAAVYAESARAHGREPRVALFREAWIGDSRAECEREWAPHALAVHRLYYNVGTYLRRFEPWVDEVRERSRFRLDRLAPGRFLYGPGAGIRAELEEWRAKTGAEYVALRLRHPGGPSHEATLEAIRRFGAEVISAPAAAGVAP
jgi:alkanesulfonate monooxygenase SsuD/methylene tetrahydromethanopterin reductase-like flavin-dependent oxidoreductase (luciferase family)